MVCHLELMTSLLLFDSCKFFKMFPYWLWSMSHHRVGGFLNWHSGVAKHYNYCLFSSLFWFFYSVKDSWWVVYFWTSVMEFGSPGSCSIEGWWGTLLLLLVFCWPVTLKNENLAVAAHVSISIPASLQVIACCGSFWCDTLVSFEPIPSPFCVGWGFSLLQIWKVYLVIVM